jgi:threonine/homoserine/homoserine lactone efflux protein
VGELTLWVVLAPILLIDVLNPVLLAAVIYALGTRRAMANAIAVLVGHTATYFAAGVALALGIEAIAERLQNPEPMDYGIELALGLVLLGVGIAMARGGGPEPDFAEDEGLGPGACFAMGSVINLIGLPFAVPYFGAISQILKADLSAAGALAVLVVYNLFYPAPFATVVAVRGIWGARADEPLRRLSVSIDRVGALLAPGLLLLLAAAFLADGAWFFLTRHALFPL